MLIITIIIIIIKFASVITTDHQKTSVSHSPETFISTYIRQWAVSNV